MAQLEELKINSKVRHITFGTGIVVEIKNDVVVVRFDKATGKRRERTFYPDSLETLDDTITEENPQIMFSVGDKVEWSNGRQGIVTDIKGDLVDVNFEKENGESEIKTIEWTYLRELKTKTSCNILSDEELEDLDIDSKFRIIPSNYASQNAYSTNAKKLMTYLRKTYADDEGIASIKSYSEEDGETGVLIVPNKGVIVFKMLNNIKDEKDLTNPFFGGFLEIEYNRFRDYYLNKMFLSKRLFVRRRVLKYPTKFVFLLQNIDFNKLNSNIKKNICIEKNQVKENLFFKNFTPFNSDSLFSNFESFDSNFEKVTQEDYGTIIERIIPENVTLVNIVSKEKEKKYNDNPTFSSIDGTEREFSALSLDEFQIKSINDTKPGVYLTLANPGTGKSVLLTSKAYRIQSTEKQNHALITCFNKNLAEHHDTFAKISGMKTGHLHISTFQSLVYKTLEKKELSFLKSLDFENNKDDFTKMIDRFETLLNEGAIKFAYNAIFIDEIQLFEPRWIDMCFKMIDKSDGKDFFFEMFGDINQDVKSQRSKGKASWQNAKTLPSLKGRVKKLDRNYRNTALISNYITHMIEDFNIKLEGFGYKIDPDAICLPSKTSTKGKIKTKIININQGDFIHIIDLVKELIENKHASYTDIAVIFPATKHGKRYMPVTKIEELFDDFDIPYSFICGDEKEGPEARCAIYDCNGIIMSTVDSSLGLDFKYVILCGLHYWDYYHDGLINKSKMFTRDLLIENRVHDYFNEIGKKIYTACSRAREGLFIFDDLISESPIKEILRPKSGKEYFDENYKK